MIASMQKLSCNHFNRICAVLGLLFLMLVVGGRTTWQEHRGGTLMQDFPQYYMGGMIARHGAWDAMYPTPLPQSRTNPGFTGESKMHPQYRALEARAGVPDESVRFIQPPPMSLLLLPLALLPYKLSYFVWLGLLILAAWGIALQAGTILRMCLGRSSRGIGLLIIAICISPHALRWVRVANISAIVGFLLGVVAIELARRDSIRGATAMVAGALAKYALLVLLPLQIVLSRWRTIAWELAIGIVLVALSLIVMGTGPFQVFFTRIAPTLGRSSAMNDNQGLYGLLLRMHGGAATLPYSIEIGFRAVQVLTLLVLLILIFLKGRALEQNRAALFAASGGLVSWLLIFSPIFWEHYLAYLAPLWGWMAFEATLSRSRRLIIIFWAVITYLPILQIARHLHLTNLPELLLNNLLLSTIVIFCVAVDRVVRGATPIDTKGIA
jgi:hypothetical protein